MNKIALAERFEGYAKVFASECPLSIDLQAMASALRKMPEEKFASILSADSYMGDGEEVESAFNTQERTIGNRMVKKTAPGTPGGAKALTEVNKGDDDNMIRDRMVGRPINLSAGEEEVVEASESAPVGDTWSKAASAAVAQNLVNDVLGMDKSICCDTHQALTKEQMPDGEKTAETPASLKKEETPDIAESLDSNIVAESNKTPLKKEAASAAQEKARENFKKMIQKKKVEKKDKEKEEKAEELDKIKAEEKKAEMKKKSRPAKEKKATEETTDASVYSTEGFEFEASIQDIEISAEEQKKLSSLFN